jgi:hypothetical protein
VANYPGNTVGFTTKTDITDTVVAADVNLAYGEITAIAGELGLNPSQRTSGTWSSTWTSSGNTKWTNVKLRLDNVENGAYRANLLLVSNTGGTTITPSSTSTLGLKIQAVSGQTANLFEAWKYGDPSAKTYIDKDGTFFTAVIDGGTA